MKNKLFNFALFYSTFISSLFLSILVLFQIFFIFKIYNYTFILPIAICISVITVLKLNRSYKYSGDPDVEVNWNLFWPILIAMFILFGLIAYFTFDKAGDARWYHQPIIILLKNGWNPIYDYYKMDFHGKTATVIHAYSKGNETLALAFVTLFNHIQIGKIINLLFFMYGFCISFLTLKIIFNLGFRQNILISLYIVFNPIFAAQYISYYTDANLFICFTVLIFSLLIWMHADVLDQPLYKKFALLNIFVSSVILINLKLTGLAYTGITLAIFFVAKIVYEVRTKELKFIFRKNLPVALGLGIIFLFMSYHPYIQNVIAHKGIFWPLMGKNLPAEFRGAAGVAHIWLPYSSKFISFFVNYFLPYPATYPPLSYAPTLKGFVAADYSFCSLGPFWGIIFIVSIYYIFKYFYRMYNCRYNDFASYAIILSLIIIIISMISNPYFMYIRYAPQVILIPALALIILFKYNVTWFSPKLQKIFIVMCIINSGLFFGGTTILTAYRSYTFFKMEHICAQNDCILEVRNNNIFGPSLRNQLKEDKINIRDGICDSSKMMIWKDALSDEQNNYICLANK